MKHFTKMKLLVIDSCILLNMNQQIRYILPRSAWQDMIIKENGESLVEIKETDRIKLGLIEKHGASFLVRKSVLDKLEKVSESLPEGFNLAIIEGYRNMENQQKSWYRSFDALKIENPSWSDGQIENQVKLVVAKPNPLANHHCGGAVDLTLCYSDGTLVDMGSPYPSKGYGIEIQKKFPMFTGGITEEQKHNRSVLRDTMAEFGFVWYPGEWWHYCYGDRMWAVYSGRAECFYGSISV